MGKGFEGHGTTHDLHGRFAYKACTEHQGMNAETLQLLCHKKAFGFLHPATETVEHVDFDYHGHVVASGVHHFLDDQAHEAHAVVEAAAPTVVAVVGIGGKELADEVAVSGVDFDAVETGLTGKIDSIAEVVDSLEDFGFGHGADESGRVEIESGGGTDGRLAAGGAVCHIAAMAQLDGGLGP